MPLNILDVDGKLNLKFREILYGVGFMLMLCSNARSNAAEEGFAKISPTGKQSDQRRQYCLSDYKRKDAWMH